MKVMIVVTHLLGTGHLARALTLVRAYLAAGHEAQVVSGGVPVPQLDRGDVPLIQLPPLRSDGVDFSRLLTADSVEADEAYRGARQAALLDALCACAPDILITELFPFGRRILRQEFGALLQAAQDLHPRPLICSSIRDILAPPSKPEKVTQTHALIAEFYDGVLIHSDPDVTPLDLSWPVDHSLAGKLHYTGFVAPPPASPHPAQLGQGEILVTAGGGDVGTPLLKAAIEAAALSPDLHWRLLIGGPAAKSAKSSTPANVTIEAPRQDFRQMLHHAAVSVSMCGYNTALDLLQSGCRAVVVPFDAGNEVEQSIRARALAQQSAITVLRSDALTPDHLYGAVEALLAQPKRPPATTGFDGAAQTVQITEALREQMV